MNTPHETRTCQTAAVTQSKKLPQRVDTVSSLGRRLERIVVHPTERSSTSQSSAHVNGARFFLFMLRLCALLLSVSRKGHTRPRRKLCDLPAQTCSLNCGTRLGRLERRRAARSTQTLHKNCSHCDLWPSPRCLQAQRSVAAQPRYGYACGTSIVGFVSSTWISLTCQRVAADSAMNASYLCWG